MAMKRLDGKVAIVTGAAGKRGMGHAIAIRLAEEGANVVVMDKYSAPKSYWTGDEEWQGLEEVVREIEALGRDALLLIADISDTKEVNGAVKKALDKFGKIDILIKRVLPTKGKRFFLLWWKQVLIPPCQNQFCSFIKNSFFSRFIDKN